MHFIILNSQIGNSQLINSIELAQISKIKQSTQTQKQVLNLTQNRILDAVSNVF